MQTKSEYSILRETLSPFGASRPAGHKTRENHRMVAARVAKELM
jgi:hypothetical protein